MRRVGSRQEEGDEYHESPSRGSRRAREGRHAPPPYPRQRATCRALAVDPILNDFWTNFFFRGNASTVGGGEESAFPGRIKVRHAWRPRIMVVFFVLAQAWFPPVLHKEDYDFSE